MSLGSCPHTASIATSPVVEQTSAERRLNTSIRFPADLHERMVVAAAERGLSLNSFVVVAVRTFMKQLLPPDEIKWTR